MFKMWKTEDEVTDVRNIEVFTTNITHDINGQVIKFKINANNLIEQF